MDRLLHFGFQVWLALALLTVLPFLLLQLARSLIWLARRPAFLRDRLAGAAARMERWTGWLIAGYLILVCTVVLFFSSQTSAHTGEPVEKILEAEDVVRQGIIWLGTPILLLNTLLRLARRQESLHPGHGEHGSR